ncbi:hypothetical protein RIR_jg13914.t1 [Rhizophagus irregularis DAOM 181602=DAOM 197198]|nr:hypothetical protein RIR_jg13914.t1 [Rhizophagus irregularis DAOM 181602=DAOM 197198]
MISNPWKSTLWVNFETIKSGGNSNSEKNVFIGSNVNLEKNLRIILQFLHWCKQYREACLNAFLGRIGCKQSIKARVR